MHARDVVKSESSRVHSDWRRVNSQSSALWCIRQHWLPVRNAFGTPYRTRTREREKVRHDAERRTLAARLSFKSGGDQSGVVAAEAEGVIQSDAHFSFAGDVGRIIQVAFFARIFQIDCRRNYRIPNGKGARGHFYSASAA